MPDVAWFDYDSLTRSRKILVWGIVVIAAIVVATLLWFLGFRTTDVATLP